MADTGVRMTPAELAAFLDEVFPQIRGEMIVEAVGPMTARLRMPVAERHLRPGGTVSGPSMFQLADCAFYVATLAQIGPEALTVTTGATINFLRKPAAADLVCEARILKLGRALVVGDATILQDGQGGPVAHATLTYSIPPVRR
ncbi:MAG: PaaI family thioesterase [Thermohalobaculum sp.]|nr:PaaI family thioesterase [Thermohalobaculum sp.]